MAFTSILFESQAYFLSRIGLPVSELPRSSVFCQYSILPESDLVFVIQDASQDDRYKQLPPVVNNNFRFYASTPIHLNDVKIGNFCIIDTKSRPDFDKDKELKLLEFGKLISAAIFEKKTIESAFEENHSFEIISSICKELLETIHKMSRTQNELTHLNRLLNPDKQSKSGKIQNQEELLNSFEQYKKDLYDKRLYLQTILQNGLTSVDNLKKSAASKLKPVNTNPSAFQLPIGEYSSVSLWFSKLQQLIQQTIPYYGKYASNVKWEFSKLSALQYFDINESSSLFLSTLLSLMIINHLQKWKYVKITFIYFQDENGEKKTTPKSISGRKSAASTPTNRSATSASKPAEGEERKVHFQCVGDEEEEQYQLVTGKLCVEVKGSTSLRPSVFSTTKKAVEEFPLFPEENQFFSICDNFISNAFQVVTGEYQKFGNKNEDFITFWIHCSMREAMATPSGFSRRKLANQKSKGSSFWNLSINNLLNNDWFYRNSSQKNPSTKSKTSFSAFVDDHSNRTAPRIEEGDEEENDNDKSREEKKTTDLQDNTKSLSTVESVKPIERSNTAEISPNFTKLNTNPPTGNNNNPKEIKSINTTDSQDQELFNKQDKNPTATDHNNQIIDSKITVQKKPDKSTSFMKSISNFFFPPKYQAKVHVVNQD